MTRKNRVKLLMAPAIFDIAATKSRLRSKSAISGARLHLVEGMSMEGAAGQVGLSKPRIHQAVTAIVNAWESSGVCPYCGGRLPRV